MQAPTQSCQSVLTRTRRQGNLTLPLAPSQTLGNPAFPPYLTQARSTPTFPPALKLEKFPRTSETMDRVASMAPKVRILGFLGTFTVLEAGSDTTPQVRHKRLTTLPLWERPLLVVYLEAPDLHIRVLWGTHFMTLSFSHPTPEDGKILAFARDNRLGLIPETVVVQPEWIDPVEVAVQRATEMEALLACLTPGHPQISAGTSSRRGSPYPGRLLPPYPWCTH